jgi:hypothetical protein
MTPGCEVTCRVEAQSNWALRATSRDVEIDKLLFGNTLWVTHQQEQALRQNHPATIVDNDFVCSKNGLLLSWAKAGSFGAASTPLIVLGKLEIKSFYADIIESLYDWFKACIMFVKFWLPHFLIVENARSSKTSNQWSSPGQVALEAAHDMAPFHVKKDICNRLKSTGGGF